MTRPAAAFEQRGAERTLRYLAEASAILSASLEQDRTLRDLARLVVPEIADWCAVSVIEGDRIRQVATAGSGDIARDTREDYIVTVPIEFGGHALGAMSMARAGGMMLSEEDIALAEELGRRAAVAVEHARLYREALMARRSAEDANAAKVEFLARMSHELRTPLNAIGGFAELLSMGLRGSLTPQQMEDVRRIQRNQVHLQTLISDILNYAKLEAGRLKYDIKTVPARPAVRAIEQIFSAHFNTGDLTWVSDFDPPDMWVVADADKLQQILMNLVGNAVKFTPRGGRVSIRGRARGAAVEIRVSDTGIGIPEEKLDIIFEPFVQVTRPGELSSGTGLGLAIARDLARGMGGDLQAEKNESGATFVLTLQKALRK